MSHQGIVLYGRDNRELDILLFPEVLDFMCRVDRVLSSPGGSLLLAGRSGVGRRTATCVVSHMHGASLFTPKISRSYSLKHFKSDLKTVSLCPSSLSVLITRGSRSNALSLSVGHAVGRCGRTAGRSVAGRSSVCSSFLPGDGQQSVVLRSVIIHIIKMLCFKLFATYSVIRTSYFVFVTGEVPGLYSTEELEPLLSSLKDQASQDGFTGPVLNYFSHRKYTHTHTHTVALKFYKTFIKHIFLFCIDAFHIATFLLLKW